MLLPILELSDDPYRDSLNYYHYILDIADVIIGPPQPLLPILDDICRIKTFPSNLPLLAVHFVSATNFRLAKHIKLCLRRTTMEIGAVADIAGVASGAIGGSEAIVALTDPSIPVTDAHTRPPTLEIQLRRRTKKAHGEQNSHKNKQQVFILLLAYDDR